MHFFHIYALMIAMVTTLEVDRIRFRPSRKKSDPVTTPKQIRIRPPDQDPDLDPTQK